MSFVCRRFAFVSLAATLLAGCGAGGQAGAGDAAPPIDADPGAGAFCRDTDPPLPPTFTNVQKLFDHDCTSCHVAPIPLDLAAPGSYANLVGRTPPDYTDPATIEACGGTLVKPGDPAGSYLFQKISTQMPCAGLRMPRTEFSFAVLPQCAQTLVHDWIQAGAMHD